ncbi:MerR HTH family regulatory protein [Rubritalea squalenifaciens DSM 18772]|uniref:MerR HTH family regulatory protein n=1 Tax=Rubritalea squalenifaciens DSM 18772 TaxID=1123071 RepID=A0A1M6GI12_9BACT|nr:helix-turn-helix domain-containing protein [Rubritalea squalenifaciens]SHJ09579.1 MerR HTH family regulatory protein [Rubritalea squalenifaciens DSM 18772]
MYKDKTKLITRRHASQRLGVSISTLKRMEQRGQLQPILVGVRSIRYREEDIEGLANNQP